MDTVDFPPGAATTACCGATTRWRASSRATGSTGSSPGVAYLDGEHPTAIFARGYYTRTTITAIDWDGRHLTERWLADSGHAPMIEPVQRRPARRGGHPTRVGDADDAGRPLALGGRRRRRRQAGDRLRRPRHSTTTARCCTRRSTRMPEGSANPGANCAKLGHGDALHVGDFDPDRGRAWRSSRPSRAAPGRRTATRCATPRPARCCSASYSGRDTGRGMVGDVDPSMPGLEAWACLPDGTRGNPEGLLTATGEPIEDSTTGDQHDHALGRATGRRSSSTARTPPRGDPTIRDCQDGVVATPRRDADQQLHEGQPVAGGRRARRLARGAARAHHRLAARSAVFLSTEVERHKLYTLMQDPQYRVEVARTSRRPTTSRVHELLPGLGHGLVKVPIPRSSK